MPATYDNWERVVYAIMLREQYRELARAPSMETSSSSTISTNSSLCSAFNADQPRNSRDFGHEISAWNRLTDQVINGADAATSFKLECLDLKNKTRQLKLLLHHAIPVTDTLCNSAHRRIMEDTKRVLHIAVSLIRRCGGMRCIFSNICSASLEAVSTRIEHCIWNLSGIFCNEQPTLRCYIGTLVTILIRGSPCDRVEAAILLATLAHDDLYNKFINKECGVKALLRLLEREKMERQDYVKKVIRNSNSLNQPLTCETISHFVKVLREGSTNLQAIVAWAASELVVRNPQNQNFFSEDFILLLVDLLSNEQKFNVHAIVGQDGIYNQKKDTTVYRNTMAARALWHLLKVNGRILGTILNSRALNHLSVLLKKGPNEAQYYSVMVLMEISSMVESSLMSLLTTDKVRAAYVAPIFLRNSTRVYRNIIKQLFVLTDIPHPELLVPSIKTVGNLHGVSCEADTWMTKSLWILLADIDQGTEVHKEACIALSKFARYENFPPSVCSNVIKSLLLLKCREDSICAGVIERLSQLLYNGDTNVQLKALFLLCYIIVHIPERAKDSPVETTSLLDWASKQVHLMKCTDVIEYLQSARTRMEPLFPQEMNAADPVTV